MIIAFSAGEIDWLIAVCNSEEYGEEFRAQLFAERLKMPQKGSKPNYVTLMDIDEATLWTIDNALFVNEPFSNYTFDQQPLKVLADKVWRCLAIMKGYLDEDDSGYTGQEDTYQEAVARTTGETR